MAAHAPPQRLSGRVVLVTGAGSGLGRAIARACAAEGATVILHGRVQRALEALYDEIVAAGGPEPVIFPLDLAKAGTEDFAAMAEAIAGQFGRLDALVHCAARLETLGPVEHQSLDQWLSMLRVNVAAPFALTRACAPLLRASAHAGVVFVLDTRGEAPRALWGGYAVSKAALGAFFRVLADEWEDLPNVRVNAVVPGPMRTPMRRRTHPGEDASLRPAPESLAGRFIELLAAGPGTPRGQVLHLAEAPGTPA